jgi:predicted metal-dependent hydrolase
VFKVKLVRILRRAFLGMGKRGRIDSRSMGASALHTFQKSRLQINLCMVFGYNRWVSIPINKLVRTRRKSVAIVVERDGSLTVRAPLRMAEKLIRSFVESHKGWIEKNQERVRAFPTNVPKQYLEGDMFLYLGQSFPLSLVPEQRPSLSFNGTTFRLALSAQPKGEEAFTHWYKAQAKSLFFERVQVFAVSHNFRYQKIRISSARTRWGSCSARGTLSFTYRLIMAPPEVVDYVVLHELVHTQVGNHSQKFWNRVEELMPDFKQRRAWLKKNGKYLI